MNDELVKRLAALEAAVAESTRAQRIAALAGVGLLGLALWRTFGPPRQPVVLVAAVEERPRP